MSQHKQKSTLVGLGGLVMLTVAVAGWSVFAASNQADGQIQRTPISLHANPHPPIGMNLSGVTYWTREWAFVDVMKIAQKWVPTYSQWRWHDDYKKHLALRPDGYPAKLEPHQAVSTLIFCGTGGHYPGGRYTLTYNGKGRFRLYFDATSMKRLGPNRYAVQVAPGNNGIGIKITNTDPNDPIHDMHLWMPGFEHAKSPFHPLFLKRLKPFNTLRFMDWGRTNTNDIERWSDRTLPSGRQSGPHGVAYEYMIDLCNQLHENMWVCVPYRADDDYIHRLAALIHNRLDPSLKVYIEYGNEMWSDARPCGKWMHEQAKAQGVKPWDYYVHHCIHIFHIFTKTFGGHQRLVRVIAGQEVNTWLTKQLLNALPSSHAADAFAIAGYFGAPKNQIVSNLGSMTVDRVLDLTEKSLTENTIPKIQAQAKLAAAAGLPLIAYEGGQGLTAGGRYKNDGKLVQLFIKANRDPRMGRMYKQLLTAWGKAGGGLFNAFNDVGGWSKWGEWGAMQYQNEPVKDAPKYQALVHLAS